MPIQGSIAEAGLPDVVQLLALGRKTGCLSMTDGATHGEIYLDGGRVSYATVANRLDRLGEVLVKSGRLTQDQLKEATEAQARGSKQQLGKILVDSGHIERQELERWVGLQVEESVYFLFTWKQGTFTFTSDRRPPHEPLPVPLEAEGLLLEGARRVDEWDLIRKRIPSFDLVYRRSKEKVGAVPAAELTYPQQRLLPLLDGTRDVTGLVDASGLSEFDVGKALYGLVTAGLAHLVERRAHVRHLEYRELLAYVVREAEFADPQRRKDAGRHIVDCPTCSDRLRTIQVRRTEGSGTFAAAAVEPETTPELAIANGRPRASAALLRPVASEASLRPVAAEAKSSPERRGGDRRTGRDRRQLDRRAGLDRRREADASWAQVHEERRQAPRRADDWSRMRRGRRSGDIERRGGAAAPAAATARPAGPGLRPTEPRLHRPFERRGRDQRSPIAPVQGDETAAERQSVAQAGGSVSDIEWLVSPDESVEMIRASRATRSPLGGGARPPVAPTATGEIRPPEQTKRTAASPGAATPSLPPAEGWTYEPLRAAPHVVPPTVDPKVPMQAARDRRLPIREMAAAATLIGAVLLAYLAGQRGGRVRADRPVETAAAEVAPPSAEAPAPSRSSARGAQGRLTPTTGAQTFARPASPADRRAPALSVPARGAALTAQPRAVQPAPEQRAAQIPPAAAAQPPAAPPAPAAAPAPTVGIVRGAVHDASGKALSGARVSVRGTALSAVTDGSGAFEIRDVPDGPVVVEASASGYVAGSADARAKAGATVAADVTLRHAASAGEPDAELAAGGWAPADRAAATATLGGTFGAIEGLTIESITQSTSGVRTRVRVAQLTESGDRIALTETRAGAAVRGAGPAVVTALRVMPPSEAYPFSTGTVSLGNILITVKSRLAPDALRALLAKLQDAAQGQ